MRTVGFGLDVDEGWFSFRYGAGVFEGRVGSAYLMASLLLLSSVFSIQCMHIFVLARSHKPYCYLISYRDFAVQAQ